MMHRRTSSLVIVSLLATVGVLSALSFAIPTTLVSSAASSTSCPASQTFNEVSEPIPTSFNQINPSGISTFVVADLVDASLTPFPFNQNGSLYWDNALINWATANANYTQWTLHIRPNAYWSDGDAITASDIANYFTPSYALNPQADFVGLGAEFKSVTIVNADTAQINLNQTDAQLLTRVSTQYFMPFTSPEAIAAGVNDNQFNNVVGSGPFITDNYTSGSTILHMTANKYYFQPNNFCALNVYFVESTSQLTPYFESGTADFSGDAIAYGDVAVMQGISGVHLNANGGNLASFLKYNGSSYPWSNVQFRQAIAYSINSSAIVQSALFGYGATSNLAQGEVPSQFGYYSNTQQTYPYNPSKSLQILHSLGFTGGGSSSTPLLYPNGTKVAFTVYTDTGKAEDVDIVRSLDTMLTNLGMQISSQTLTHQNLQTDYASNAFNMRNELVVYTSGGALFQSVWVQAQQECNVFGTPGCFGWQNTPDPTTGFVHEEWTPAMDQQYQSNLTAINNTPPTDATKLNQLMGNIQNIRAADLPVIMLAYPDELFPYTTFHFTNWPSWYLSNEGQSNKTIFGTLVPVSGGSTVTSTQTNTQTNTVTNTQTQTNTQTNTVTNTQTQTNTITSTSTSSSVALSWSIVAVIMAIILAAAALLMVRRDPTSRKAST